MNNSDNLFEALKNVYGRNNVIELTTICDGMYIAKIKIDYVDYPSEYITKAFILNKPVYVNGISLEEMTKSIEDQVL